MATKRHRKNDLFHAASEIADPQERAAYLANVCGTDAELRQEIESLLEHDAAAGSFFATTGDCR